MMARAHSRWSPKERANLEAWRKAGFCRRTIADRLQRSVCAIEMQIKINRMPRVERPKKQELPPVAETIAIPKDLVCDFYEKGWRFDGFSTEGLCVMRKELDLALDTPVNRRAD